MSAAHASPSALDALDVELIRGVLAQTLFSPFFTMGICATLLIQGYTFRDTPLQAISALCTMCTAVWLGTFLDHVWRNRLWRGGLAGICRTRRIRWEEQVVVVTGGASGLGRQIVDTLAARHVTVVSLDLNHVDAVTESLYTYRCDLTKREEVFAVADRVRRDVGDPTVLVNNAGVVAGKPLLELSELDIRRTFDVNVVSHYWTIQAFLPAMVQRKSGHLVSVASILAFAGVVELADYTATKAALLGLHDSLRAELRHLPDIRLSIVFPGHMPTTLFEGARIPNPVARFLLPTIDPFRIAQQIIATINTHEGRDIYIPWIGRFAWLDRASPYWLRDLVHWVGWRPSHIGVFLIQTCKTERRCRQGIHTRSQTVEIKIALMLH